MDINNITSGKDYAHLIISNIVKIEKTLPLNQQMPIGLFIHLTTLIEIKSDKYYLEYIIGKRKTFIFENNELIDIFNKAGELYASDIIDGLVDKGMLEASIDEKGEILYGTTKKGNKAIKQYKLDNNLNIKKRGRPRKK
jgi:hypothetical protein